MGRIGIEKKFWISGQEVIKTIAQISIHSEQINRLFLPERGSPKRDFLFFSGRKLWAKPKGEADMNDKQKEYWAKRYEKLISLSVELPRELREELRIAAKQEGISSGEFIRRAIRERLAD